MVAQILEVWDNILYHENHALWHIWLGFPLLKETFQLEGSSKYLHIVAIKNIV